MKDNIFYDIIAILCLAFSILAYMTLMLRDANLLDAVRLGTASILLLVYATSLKNNWRINL